MGCSSWRVDRWGLLVIETQGCIKFMGEVDAGGITPVYPHRNAPGRHDY
jgi:hypothetical protein